jgi:hypothetical protein
MKFSNIVKFFTLPTLTEVSNIYNDNTSIIINDEIQKGNMVYDVNERIKCYNIANCFTLPTLTEVSNIYNTSIIINDKIQTGNIIQDGIMVYDVN